MRAQENRWLSEAHTRDWLARQSEGAARPEQFDLLARLLPFDESSEPAIADLGAGHGTLSEVLLDHFPRAHAVCLDVNQAMIEAGRERGLVWTEETLDGFLADPEAYLPGTWMSFVGLADPAERAAVIAYLNDAAD